MKTSTMITMEYDEFVEQFQPIQNHLDDNASWDGFAYETFGKEAEHIKKVHDENPGLVWTIMDSGNGELFIGDGMHFCNRFGYIITKKTAAENTFYEINDED